MKVFGILVAADLVLAFTSGITGMAAAEPCQQSGLRATLVLQRERSRHVTERNASREKRSKAV